MHHVYKWGSRESTKNSASSMRKTLCPPYWRDCQVWTNHVLRGCMRTVLKPIYRCTSNSENDEQQEIFCVRWCILGRGVVALGFKLDVFIACYRIYVVRRYTEKTNAWWPLVAPGRTSQRSTDTHMSALATYVSYPACPTCTRVWCVVELILGRQGSLKTDSWVTGQHAAFRVSLCPCW